MLSLSLHNQEVPKSFQG